MNRNNGLQVGPGYFNQNIPLKQKTHSEVSSRRDTPSFHSAEGEENEDLASKHVSFFDDLKSVQKHSKSPQNEQRGRHKAKLSDLCSEDKRKIEDILQQLTTEAKEKRELHEQFIKMQDAYEGKLERIRKTSKDAYKDHRNLRKDLSESIRVLEESQQNLKSKSLRLSQLIPSSKSLRKKSPIKEGFDENEEYQVSARVGTETSGDKANRRSELKLSDIQTSQKFVDGMRNSKHLRNHSSSNKQQELSESKSQFRGSSSLLGKKKMVEELKSEISDLGERIKIIGRLKGRGDNGSSVSPYRMKNDQLDGATDTTKDTAGNKLTLTTTATQNNEITAENNINNNKYSPLVSVSTGSNTQGNIPKDENHFELSEIRSILFESDNGIKQQNMNKTAVDKVKQEIWKQRTLLEQLEATNSQTKHLDEISNQDSELKLSNLLVNKSFQTSRRNPLLSDSRSKQRKSSRQKEETQDIRSEDVNQLIKTEPMKELIQQLSTKEAEQLKLELDKKLAAQSYTNQLQKPLGNIKSQDQKQLSDQDPCQLSQKFQQYLQIKSRVMMQQSPQIQEPIDSSQITEQNKMNIEIQPENDIHRQTVKKQLLQDFKGADQDSANSKPFSSQVKQLQQSHLLFMQQQQQQQMMNQGQVVNPQNRLLFEQIQQPQQQQMQLLSQQQLPLWMQQQQNYQQQSQTGQVQLNYPQQMSQQYEIQSGILQQNQRLIQQPQIQHLEYRNSLKQAENIYNQIQQQPFSAEQIPQMFLPPQPPTFQGQIPPTVSNLNTSIGFLNRQNSNSNYNSNGATNNSLPGLGNYTSGQHSNNNNSNLCFETFCQNESIGKQQQTTQPSMDFQQHPDKILEFYIKEQQKKVIPIIEGTNQQIELKQYFSKDSDSTIRNLGQVYQQQIGKDSRRESDWSFQEAKKENDSFSGNIQQSKTLPKQQQLIMNGNNINNICERNILRDNDEELSEIIGLLNHSEDSIYLKDKNNRNEDTCKNSKNINSNNNKNVISNPRITPTIDNCKQPTNIQQFPPQSPSPIVYQKPKSLERQAQHNKFMQEIVLQGGGAENSKIATQQLIQRYSELVGQISQKLRIKDEEKKNKRSHSRSFKV